MSRLSTPIFFGLLLLVPGVVLVVWGLVLESSAEAAGRHIVENWPALFGVYLFGWPALVLLGIGLLRGNTRAAKITGALLMLIAAAPVAQLIFQMVQ